MTADSEVSLSQLYALGNEAYQEDQDLDRAIEMFRQVLARAPRWEKPRAKLGGLLLHRGRGRLEAGNLLGAIADMREAYRVHPDTPKLSIWFQTALQDLARDQLSRRRFDIVIATLDEWIEVFSGETWAAELKVFIQAASDQGLAALGRAFEHLRHGAYESAIDDLSRLTELEPHGNFVRRELGSVLLQMGLNVRDDRDWEGALKHFEEAATWIPDDEELLVYLVGEYRRHIEIATKRRDFEAAHDLLTRGLRAAPEDEGFSRLRNALSQLPTELFDSYSGPVIGADGTQLPDLILIEAGVDTSLLNQYLSVFGNSEFISEFRYKTEDPTLGNVKSLLDLQSTGGVEDRTITQKAVDLAASLNQAIVDTARGDWVYRDHDLLGFTSYEVEDYVYSALREVGALLEIVDPSRYGRVVLIAGNGGLTICAKEFLLSRFGQDRCYVMWCSRALNRYQARADNDLGIRTLESLDRTTKLVLDLRRWWGRRRVRRASPWASTYADPGAPPRVLLVASPSYLHVTNLAEIAQYLVESSSVVALLLAKTKRRVYDRLRELSGRYGGRFVMDPLELSDASANWRSHGEASASSVVAELDHHSILSELATDSFSLWPLLRPKIEHVMAVRLPVIRAFARAIEDRIASNHPHALVVSPDRLAEARVAISLARDAGVTTFFPQPLLISDSPRYKPLEADYAFVIDHFSKELYLNRSFVDPSRVIVIGSTRLEATAQRARNASRQPPVGEQTVLLALQRFSVEYAKTFISVVADAVAPLQKTRMLVRMHPGDPAANRSHYEAELWSHLDAARSAVSNEDDLNDQILGSDLVVSTFSNVVLEAALLFRPVLCVNLMGGPLPIPFVDLGLAVGAETEHEVGELIRRLLTDEEYRRGVMARQSHYFSINSHLRKGEAALRMATLISDLSNPRSSASNGV